MADVEKFSQDEKASIILALDCQVRVLERAKQKALTPVIAGEYDKAISDFKRIASKISLKS